MLLQRVAGTRERVVVCTVANVVGMVERMVARATVATARARAKERKAKENTHDARWAIKREWSHPWTIGVPGLKLKTIPETGQMYIL